MCFCKDWDAVWEVAQQAGIPIPASVIITRWRHQTSTTYASLNVQENERETVSKFVNQIKGNLYHCLPPCPVTSQNKEENREQTCTASSDWSSSNDPGVVCSDGLKETNSGGSGGCSSGENRGMYI